MSVRWRTVLIGRLKRNRERLDQELRSSWTQQYFSPAMLGLYKEVVPRLKAHASGRLLDAGCGAMPFHHYLEGLVQEYHSLDIEERVPGVTVVADIQDMGVLPSETYDTVLCCEVLEHVPQPQRAICEIRRVLKPYGTLIVTVPFLSRLHEEPFDYFRYTRHGLRFLLEKSGLELVEIVPMGSLFSFLGHQISTVIVCTFWHIPILKWLAFWLNALLCTLPCHWLDRLPGIARILPLGYVAVAVRR